MNNFDINSAIAAPYDFGSQIGFENRSHLPVQQEYSHQSCLQVNSFIEFIFFLRLKEKKEERKNKP